MKFLVDTQLPPVLAKFLRSKGVNAVHTTYFAGGELMSDYAIRLNAVSDDRIIITKDSDFFENYLAQGAPPRILLIQMGNIRNRFFDLHWSSIIQQFESGAGLIILERENLTIY